MLRRESAKYGYQALAVVYATIGIFFHARPLWAYALGGVFGLGVLVFLLRTRQPWLYYYCLALISLMMLLVGLLGVEI
jgi:hypothetical protein